MSMVGTETATQYFYVVLERSVPARFFKDRPRCKAGQCFGFNDSISKEKSDLLRNGKLQRHDIVYTMRGTVGNAAYYSDSML